MDDVNDDILGLILERLDSHPILIRAASTCKRWRCAIADARFLRRYLSLHGPTVAGHYFDNWRRSPPSRREPLFVSTSPSLIDSRHFSLYFLPFGVHLRRQILDSRGSLLVDLSDGPYIFWTFPDLVVCEPLTQRHVRIPMPGFKKDGRSCDLYLMDGDAVDASGGRSIGMSNFRVMCVFHRGDVAHAGVFTFAGGSGAWSEKTVAWKLALWTPAGTARLGRAGGSWYFYVADGTVVALDGSTGELSPSASLPATVANAGMMDVHLWLWSGNFFVTDERDGRPRIVVVVDGIMKVFARFHDDEWALEKEMVLSEVTHGLPGYKPWFFNGRRPVNVVTKGNGFVILSVKVSEYADNDIGFFEFRSRRDEWFFFSIDLETMEVAPAAEGLGAMAFPCELPWPPALHACLN